MPAEPELLDPEPDPPLAGEEEGVKGVCVVVVAGTKGREVPVVVAGTEKGDVVVAARACGQGCGGRSQRRLRSFWRVLVAVSGLEWALMLSWWLRGAMTFSVSGELNSNSSSNS